MNTKIILVSITLVIGLVTLMSGVTNKDGCDSFGNGPDEGTCQTCHGFTVGTGSIKLTSSNMLSGGTYIPGKIYHLTVTVTDPTGLVFGFSFEALDASNKSVGTLIVTDKLHTWEKPSAFKFPGRTYMVHTGSASPSPGVPTTSNPAVFNFDWQAPSIDVGDITFYYAGLAANNNGSPDSGDKTYAGSKVITYEAATDITPFKKEFSNISILPNPSSDILKVKIEGQNNIESKVIIYNTMGKIMKTTSVQGNEFSIVINDLSKGTYILMVESNKDKYSSKFIVD